MLGTFSITSTDSLGKQTTENLGSIIADELTNSSTAVEFATTLDTFARGIINLTNNTYKDSKAVITVSINEILADA